MYFFQQKPAACVFRGKISLWQGAIVWSLLAAHCASTPQKLESLPTLTSKNAAAQLDYDRASEAEAQHHIQQAGTLYQAFLERYPDDSLIPLARLGLGRILLNQGAPEKADEQFLTLRSHAHAGIRERAELYHGVALAEQGQSNEAIPLLMPYVGRTADAHDKQWLERSLLKAAEASKDSVLSLRALATLQEEGDAANRPNVNRVLKAQLIKATHDDVLKAYQSLPRNSTVWGIVAKQAFRHAFEQGDTALAQNIANELNEQRVPLEADVRMMMVRLEQRHQVDHNKIGVLLPLSGRAKLIGQSALQALQLAASEDGVSLADHLIIKDTAGDPTKAANAFDELLEHEHVIAVIGPVVYDAVLSVAERAKYTEIPVLTLTNTARVTEAGKTLLRLLPSPQGELSALVRRAKERGAQRFGILYPDGKYGQTMRETFLETVRQQQGLVVFNQAYPPGTTHFKEAIQTLQRSGAQALFIPDTSKAIALIAPTLAAMGLWSMAPDTKPSKGQAITLILPHAGFDLTLASLVGRYLQGAVFSVPFDPALQQASVQHFSQRYREQFNAEPDVFAAYAYDAYQLIRAGIRAGIQSRTELLTFLTSHHTTVTTVSAAHGFTPDRGPRQETQLVELIGTEFVTLPPPVPAQ